MTGERLPRGAVGKQAERHGSSVRDAQRLNEEVLLNQTLAKTRALKRA